MIVTSLKAIKNINHQLRKEIAMAYRLIRRSILLNRIPPHEENPKPKFGERIIMKILPPNTMYEGMHVVSYSRQNRWLAVIVLLIALGIMCLFSSCAHAQEFSNVQIVNAIYMAEGGSHADYPYGIRSVKCSSNTECRRVCLTTVKRNRQRFARFGYKNYHDFIAYLGARYCPVKGKLSSAEIKVNRFWIKNVRYFLSK